MRTNALLRPVALLALLFLLTLLTLAGCKKPQPPQLTPVSALVTTVDVAGVDLRVAFDAHNPNAFDLSVQKVTGHVVLDGKHDLGTVIADRPFVLPANQRTRIEVPMRVRWTDAGILPTLAATRRAIPYVVDGTATIGGEKLNLDIPFALKGELTQQQLVQATLNSLQNLPGLPPGLLPQPPK